MGSKLLGLIVAIALIALLIYFGMTWQRSRDERYPWKGTFSKISETTPSKESDEFKTLEECKAWAADRASDLGLSEGQWEFSCGSGCEFTDDTIVSGRRIRNYDCDELITE